MKTALRIHIALNELVVGMICISIIICVAVYLKAHRAEAPAPVPVKADCAVKEPTVEISQIIYFIPVPAPKVEIKVVVPPKEHFGEDDGDFAAPEVKPQSDPVFQHRTPIITDALRTPMSVLAKN